MNRLNKCKADTIAEIIDGHHTLTAKVNAPYDFLEAQTVSGTQQSALDLNFMETAL